MMKTFMANAGTVEQKWYVVDADGKTLGRLASQVAAILRGKNKPYFTPHVDCGDYVIIVNADKIQVTGKKHSDKIYKSYTGYQSGLKERTFDQMMDKHPTFALEHAIEGMLPKNALGREMLKKLKIYAGPDHMHQAQKPEVLDI